MNKPGGGAGIGGGPVGGGGPTAAAATAAAQKQKALLQRVDTDIANIVDNFSHLVNVSRVIFQLLLFYYELGLSFLENNLVTSTANM